MKESEVREVESFMGRISKIVDEELEDFFTGITTKELASFPVETIDKKTSMMKEEASAYIDAKFSMYKSLINRLSEIE